MQDLTTILEGHARAWELDAERFDREAEASEAKAAQYLAEIEAANSSKTPIQASDSVRRAAIGQADGYRRSWALKAQKLRDAAEAARNRSAEADKGHLLITPIESRDPAFMGKHQS